LESLKDNGYPLNENIIYSFGEKENEIDILKWVFANYNTISENHKIEGCVLSGNLEGIIQCLEEGMVFNEKLVVWALKSGHMEIVQWLTINQLIPKYIN